MPEDTSVEHIDVPDDLSRQSESQPLPASLQHQFEASFGQDLSEVRVHQGHAAVLLQAESFSRGDNLFFAPGLYQPHTGPGDTLIAHELAHVIQQRGSGKPQL